jgi:hypothetical protein
MTVITHASFIERDVGISSIHNAPRAEPMRVKFQLAFIGFRRKALLRYKHLA